jgi:hypothetical protein
MSSSNPTSFGSGFEVGQTVLYQAPGTHRVNRVLAKITKMPCPAEPFYTIHLGDRTVECCWFSIDLLPRKANYSNVKGVFAKDLRE